MDKNLRATLSVVMPVYNAAPYLAQTLESLLAQTHADFELLALNDGSTDESLAILNQYAARDARIRVLHSAENRGLVFQLNKGMAAATGEFIARMDSDDICVPTRFETQLRALRENEHIDVIGSAIRRFSGESVENGIDTWIFPDSTEGVLAHLFFKPCHAHPTVMFRRKLVDNGDFQYLSEAFPSEDYDLWTRLATRYNMTNLTEVLLYYRVSDGQISTSESPRQKIKATETRLRYVQNSHVRMSEAETGAFRKGFIDGWDGLNAREAADLFKVFEKIMLHNSSPNFRKQFAQRVYQFVVPASTAEHPYFSLYRRSEMNRYYDGDVVSNLKARVKQLVKR